MSKLSHLDEQGRASMVDVSDKDDTMRTATAEAVIVLSPEAFDLVISGKMPKGDVFAAARLAGIMAAKKTSELIPLCHPLALSHVGVDFAPDADRHAIAITTSAKTKGPTGVEMEALTAASVAALTIYDMIKAVDRSARIEAIRILSKAGGKSGTYALPEKERPAPGPVAQTRGGRRSAPRILMGEVAAVRAAPIAHAERDALRAFMLERRLRVSDWAKSANVPSNEIYGFLSGRARSISEESAKNLARAARATVADMFSKKKS